MPRGSKPGERRGGRKKGTPNKATAEIKALCREYAPEAVEKLKQLMKSSDGKVSLGAIREILDRGYGKSSLTVGVDVKDQPVRRLTDEQLIALIITIQGELGEGRGSGAGTIEAPEGAE